MYTNSSFAYNIDSSKQPRESRYLLNDYITSQKKIISINGAEYEVTLYQGDHSNEYLLSEMKEGKVEGRCQLFNRGILILAWMMKNGKRIGGVTEYKNGKALQRENWDSIVGNDGDRRMIENSKEGLIMTIRCKRKGENDEENDDDMVIYRGGFDEEMNRDGYGIEYDIENDGKEKIEGYWSKDKLIRMIREFDVDNNQMIEYAEDNDEKGNAGILNRIPIYIGGYSIENGKFVRHRLGYLIDEASGTAIRESEWEYGLEKKGGIDLYEGWYVKGMNESIRSVLKNENPRELKNDNPYIMKSDHGYLVKSEDLTELKNERDSKMKNEDQNERKHDDPIDIMKDNPREMKSESLVNVPMKRMEIHNSSELNEMDMEVTELVICSNSCNDMNELNLNRFKWLESMEIGDDCFGSVQTLKMDGLNRLKSLKIGSNSFTEKKNWYGNCKSKSFHILNCKSLESIEIGEYSFSDFAGDFELKNCPQLQSIQIGTIGSWSYNFRFSSFLIRGIELILKMNNT